MKPYQSSAQTDLDNILRYLILGTCIRVCTWYRRDQPENNHDKQAERLKSRKNSMRTIGQYVSESMGQGQMLCQKQNRNRSDSLTPSHEVWLFELSTSDANYFWIVNIAETTDFTSFHFYSHHNSRKHNNKKYQNLNF